VEIIVPIVAPFSDFAARHQDPINEPRLTMGVARRSGEGWRSCSRTPEATEKSRAAMTSRILIADDDPILRELVQAYLSDEGYSLTLVEDGREALKAARGAHFDLIITDMVMPNLDGIELLQALRSTTPQTPVLAMSAGIAGCHADLLLRAASAVGAVSVLRKPLNREALLEVVRDLLQCLPLPVAPRAAAAL
jgi:CheY-like chemotaxis protein